MALLTPSVLFSASRAALAAAVLMPALISAGSAAPTRELPAQEPAQSDAALALQHEFADAPDGVDPMVTGPVTTAFRDRQKQAGCEFAEWPNIPRVCYPD